MSLVSFLQPVPCKSLNINKKAVKKIYQVSPYPESTNRHGGDSNENVIITRNLTKKKKKDYKPTNVLSYYHTPQLIKA